jgi:hypothetical protein
MYCLDNCFIRFASDFGCKGVLYPSFYLYNALWLLAMKGTHTSLFKKKKTSTHKNEKCHFVFFRSSLFFEINPLVFEIHMS